MAEHYEETATCDDTVEAELGRDVARIQKLRRCLMCWADFLSQWSGERICAKCRARSVWRSGG
jgi:hypothetical protein